jgi:hypothetical protein
LAHRSSLWMSDKKSKIKTVRQGAPYAASFFVLDVE